jgi:transcriptional regulator with XRE-family HTH domain
MSADMADSGIPQEQALGDLLREVLDLADEVCETVTDADIEARLHRITTRAATPAQTTARLRQLGSQLRRLREAHELELEETAQRLGLATSVLSHIESGGVPGQGHLTSMLDIYDVQDSGQRHMLLEMARGGHSQDWWAVGEDRLPTGFGVYVSMEAEAASLRVYESQVIFGLLQTEEYARAVITMVGRRNSPAEVDRMVKVRMQRQHVLQRPEPLKLHVILDEAVLRRAMGPPQLMRRQLAHLSDAAAQPNITIQLLDFSGGIHPALNGSFCIMKFPGHLGPDIVYSEGVSGHAYIEERPGEVQARADVFGLLSSTALSPDESIRLIHSISETFADG